MGSRSILFCLITLCFAAAATISLADADGAKKYVDEAKQKVDAKDGKEAETSLKLAEAELEGVDAAAKGAIVKQIVALRAQIAEMAGSEEKVQLIKNIDYNLRMAKESLSSKNDLKTFTDEAEKFVTGDEGKKYLDEPTRKKYLQQIATYRKAGVGMSLDADLVRLTPFVERAEEKLPKVLEAIKQNGPDVGDANNFEQDLKGLNNDLKQLPADNPKVKALNDRYKKLSTQFLAAASSGMNAKTLESLKRYWDSHTNDFAGWEKETGTPSFDQVVKEQSDSMSKLQQPRTVEMVSRADNWLKDLEKNEDAKAAADDPQIKALVASVQKQRDAGVAKLVKAIEKVLSEAEKTTLDKNKAERLGYFVDNIRLMLDGAPQQEALQARAKATVDKFNGGVATDAAAMQATLTTLTAQAAAGWPAMAAKFSTTEEFDPAEALKDGSKYKGKYILFKGVRNRLGWDYAPGGYAFAITRNGLPIAAKNDPSIRAAVEDVKRKTGQELPEEDGWDVIATYETAGKIEKRVNLEGKIKDTNLTVTAEKFESIDTPVLKIVALHIGPVAAAVGQGAVSESGTVAPLAMAAGSTETPTAGAASSGGGAAAWLHGVFMLIIGLVAAGVALMKGKFAPLAGLPQAGQVQAKVGDGNLAIIGLVCALIGIFWVLLSLLHLLRGVLVPAAITAAGVIAAVDFLAARGLVKPDLAAKLRPLAVPVGLACAALVILGLITRGSLYLI